MNNKSFLDHMADVIKQKPKFNIDSDLLTAKPDAKSEYRMYAQQPSGRRYQATTVTQTSINATTTWNSKVEFHFDEAEDVGTPIASIFLVNPENIVLYCTPMPTIVYGNDILDLKLTIPWGLYTTQQLKDMANLTDDILRLRKFTNFKVPHLPWCLSLKDLHRLNIIP